MDLVVSCSCLLKALCASCHTPLELIRNQYEEDNKEISLPGFERRLTTTKRRKTLICMGSTRRCVVGHTNRVIFSRIHWRIWARFLLPRLIFNIYFGLYNTLTSPSEKSGMGLIFDIFVNNTILTFLPCQSQTSGSLLSHTLLNLEMIQVQKVKWCMKQISV